MTHVSCNSNKYSERAISLNLQIDAPYGCALLDYPKRPKLYSTNTKIKKTNPVSVIGIISGAGLCIAGIAIESDHLQTRTEEDGELDLSALLSFLFGVGILSIGIQNLYNYVPNTYLNYQNEIKNKDLLRDWKSDCQRIDFLNNRIKNTFTIKFKIK